MSVLHNETFKCSIKVSQRCLFWERLGVSLTHFKHFYMWMENPIVNQGSINTKQTLRSVLIGAIGARTDRIELKLKKQIQPKQLFKTCQRWKTQSAAVAVRSDWGEVLGFVGSFSSLALVDVDVWFGLICVSSKVARFLKQMETSLHCNSMHWNYVILRAIASFSVCCNSQGGYNFTLSVFISQVLPKQVVAECIWSCYTQGPSVAFVW